MIMNHRPILKEVGELRGLLALCWSLFVGPGGCSRILYYSGSLGGISVLQEAKIAADALFRICCNPFADRA